MCFLQCMRFPLEKFWLLFLVTLKSSMISAGRETIRGCCLLRLMELSGELESGEGQERFVLFLVQICLSWLKYSKIFIIFLLFREWNVKTLSESARKVLPHPSFVYSAQYHPTEQNLVVTGGYDSLLRVWRLDTDDVNGQLLQEFDGHNSFINTICFDPEGTEDIQEYWGYSVINFISIFSGCFVFI